MCWRLPGSGSLYSGVHHMEKIQILLIQVNNIHTISLYNVYMYLLRQNMYLVIFFKVNIEYYGHSSLIGEPNFVVFQIVDKREIDA